MAVETPETFIASETYQPDPVILHRATLIAFVQAVKHNEKLRGAFDKLVTALTNGHETEPCLQDLHHNVTTHFFPEGYAPWRTKEVRKNGTVIASYPYQLEQPVVSVAMVDGMAASILHELRQWEGGSPQDALHYIDAKSGFRQLVPAETGESAHRNR